MLAYHDDPKVKALVVKQLKAHAKADELVQGIGWKHGKGCAVGCTLHAYNHALYEERFGIPEMLARLEDRIFEGMTPAAAQKWPVRFMSAIRPGADLSLVGWRFLSWLMTDKVVNPGIDHPLVRDAVKTVADGLALLADGKPWAPASAAAAAAQCAAAEQAAQCAAEWAAARAAPAAWAAARAAAARAAAMAAPAWAAARAAEWAAGAAVTAARASASAYARMGDKLIELLKAS